MSTPSSSAMVSADFADLQALSITLDLQATGEHLSHPPLSKIMKPSVRFRPFSTPLNDGSAYTSSVRSLSAPSFPNLISSGCRLASSTRSLASFIFLFKSVPAGILDKRFVRNERSGLVRFKYKSQPTTPLNIVFFLSSPTSSAFLGTSMSSSEYWFWFKKIRPNLSDLIDM